MKNRVSGSGLAGKDLDLMVQKPLALSITSPLVSILFTKGDAKMLHNT